MDITCRDTLMLPRGSRFLHRDGLVIMLWAGMRVGILPATAHDPAGPHSLSFARTQIHWRINKAVSIWMALSS